MGNFLDQINEKLNKKNFNDWYADDIFFDVLLDESSDDFILILKKYSDLINNYKNKKVELRDAEIILEHYKADYNVLIKAFLDFLLANNNDLRLESNLVSDCEEYINLYFKNITIIKDALALKNMKIVLNWTIYKFKSEKEVIKKVLYFNLMNSNQLTHNIFIIHMILTSDDLRNLFNSNEYKSILDKNLKKDVKDNQIKFYVNIYNDFLDYFDKNKENKKYKELLKQYCDFILYNISKLDNFQKQSELQKVRKYMDNFQYSDNDYIIVDNELEKANEIALKNLKFINISIPKNFQEELKNYTTKYNQIYQSLKNGQKILELIFSIPVASKTLLRESYENSKFPLKNLFPSKYLDNTGRIINYDKNLTEEQEFLLEIKKNIAMMTKIFFYICFMPFYNKFKMDEDAISFIKNVTRNNKLIEPNRIEIITEQFIYFFNGDYEHSIFDIILEFESSLRYYFKNCGLNIKKRNKNGDYIGLNNIFNDNKKNNYRDELLKIIDEDYYFIFKYFLVDEYGYNLRDRIAHRIDSINIQNTFYAIYITVHIFRLYCFMQK